MMSKFLKNIIIFNIPLFVLLLSYIIIDPFMVIYDYDNFYVEDRIPVEPDKDFVSTSMYLKNKETIGCNSFIFGNSRSKFYETEKWKQHIGQSSKCLHFDASGESLYGILKKIEFIDKNDSKLENALFIIDNQVLKQSKPRTDSHLFYISPQLVNYSNVFGFHLSHLKSYLNPRLFAAIFDYISFQKLTDFFTRKQVLYFFNGEYDKTSNELRYTEEEKLIVKGEYYTPRILNTFKAEQIYKIDSPIIGEEQKDILFSIKRILDKHKTEYKIVISPLYNQLKLNPIDLEFLQELFGTENVHDYSGKNDITDNYLNYYENSHYRPHIANRIMDEIYSN